MPSHTQTERERRRRRVQIHNTPSPRGGGGPAEFGRDLIRNAGELAEGAFPATRRQFNEQGAEIREAASRIPDAARAVADAETAEERGVATRRTLGEVGQTAFEVGANAVQTAGALAQDVIAPLGPILRGARSFLGLTPNANAATRPPESPQTEAGQADTNNGTPNSEVVGPTDPLSTVLPGGGSEGAAPVALSQIGPDSTRVAPRPPDAAPGDDLPPGSVRIHMGGRGVFIQDPSGVRFRELPGLTIAQSREAAANAAPGEQFRQEQIVSRQNADANTTSAAAQATRAQVDTRITVINADNTLSIRERDANGELVDLQIEPHIQDIIDGTDVYSYKTIATDTGDELIQFNETQNTRKNISKDEANQLAVAQYNKLIDDGEDPEDAIEEVEKTFGLFSLNIQ